MKRFIISISLLATIYCVIVASSQETHLKNVGIDNLDFPQTRNGQVDYTIKLVGCTGTEAPYAGRLEIFYLGEWGTICGDTFDNKVASVACYSLGYQRGRAIFVQNEYGGPEGKRIWLGGVSCIGNETHLDGCQHPDIGRPTGCSHAQDAYVACDTYKYADGKDILGYEVKVCNSSFDCTPGEMEWDGLLHIKYNQKWGTACGGTTAMFDNVAATIACRGIIRHLDPNEYNIIGIVQYEYRNFEVEDDTVPIWLGAVKCYGTERNVGSCEHPAWGVNTCHHYNDAWISCRAVNKRTGSVLTKPEYSKIMEAEKRKRKVKQYTGHTYL